MIRLLLHSIFYLTSFTVLSQSIEGFSGYNVINDDGFSLSELNDSNGIIVIFYSNKCAYGEYYLDRIKSIIKEFSPKGIDFVLVNSNSSAFVEEESVEGMKTFATRNNINYPYIADKDRKIKSLFKATRTPEVIVLQPMLERFIIHYQGAIDDNAQSASDVSHQYLKESIVSLLTSEKPKLNKTRPVGCLIK